ncbi:MAG: hypothetical protein HFI37_08560 [Lachnospiraceae bacterium]|nr:hypothetical protein [Lachnospiraceae bacterium]
MAEIKRQPFQTIHTDLEELDRKIREHRLKIARRVGIVVGAVLLFLLLFYVINQLRTYDGHKVKSSYERQDTAATTFMTFQGGILKYSNDGAFYTDISNDLIWNQAYEMENPMVDLSKKYIAIGDKGGNRAYILDKEGLCGKIETTKPIVRIKVANQGTLAILMEDEGVGYIKICDNSGKDLAEGEFHAQNSGYPLDIALSEDGEKLAVSILDIKSGVVKTVISFYNFGSAGQKKIDNVVATYEYDDIVIPQIEYINNDKMIAVSDKNIMFFEGTKKPQEKKKIKFDSRLRTFFFNDKYIGMIFDNENSGGNKKNDVYCLKTYDNRGGLIKEKTFSRTYRKAEFLDNNEICLINNNECTIFTLRGVEKYHEALDKNVYKILPGNIFGSYIFILEGETAEMKLK